MSNQANSSTIQSPAQIEAELVAEVRQWAPKLTSAAAEFSMLDDAIDGRAGPVLGRERCAEIVHAGFVRARAAERAKVDEARGYALLAKRTADAAAGQPELEETIEGLEKTLERSAQEVRWNTRGRCEEWRMVGGEEWIECVGDVLDDMFVRCSQVARLRVGRGTIPWKIRSRKDESRVLGFVARKRPEAGKADRVHEDILEWALQIKQGVFLLTEVEEKGGGLHKNERGARAPRWVERSAEAALIEAKWVYKCVRLPWGPRKRWVPPGGPGKLRETSAGPRKRRATSAGPRRVKLAPSSYAKG